MLFHKYYATQVINCDDFSQNLDKKKKLSNFEIYLNRTTTFKNILSLIFKQYSDWENEVRC